MQLGRRNLVGSRFRLNLSFSPISSFLVTLWLHSNDFSFRQGHPMFPQYLVKNPSNSSFFFRTIIPLDIRDLFGGIIEFRVSLKCVSKLESNKICLHLNNRVETIYEQIRMGKSLTIDEMKRILKKEIEKSKKHSSFFSYVG